MSHEDWVMGSGTTLAVKFDAPIATLANPTDTQTIGFTGIPSGSGFALIFGGRTTETIPGHLDPPNNFVLVVVPTVVGHTYNFAATWMTVGKFTVGLQVFQILGPDQATVLHSSNQSQQSLPSDFQDGTTFLGNPLFWNNLNAGSPITATGTHLYVRISAQQVDEFGQQWYVNAMRVVDNTASTVTKYSDQDPSYLYSIGTFGASQSGKDTYLGTNTNAIPTGAGPVYRVNASDAQSALRALGSDTIGITVEAVGNNSLTAKFLGPLAGTLQPLMTCSDGAVSIVHTNPGGNYPSYTKNGGSPVVMTQPPNFGTFGGASTLQWVADFLQAPPTFQYALTSDSSFVRTGASSIATQPGPGFVSGKVWVGNAGSVSSATYRFPRLGVGGTFQFGLTFRSDPGLGAAIPVDLIDQNGNVLFTTTINQTIAPSSFVDGGFNYLNFTSYTIAPGSGINTLSVVVRTTTGSGSAQMDAVRCHRTSSDTSVKFLSTDTIALTFADGYVSTTTGPIPGGTFTLENRVGKPLVDFVEAPKTMKVGTNFSGDFGPCPIYRNIARRIGWNLDVQQGLFTNFDPATGEPILQTVQTVHGVVAQPFLSAQGGTGFGMDNAPGGKYACIWDGDGTNAANDLVMENFDQQSYTVTEDVSYRNVGHATNNVRVYDIRIAATNPGVFSPSIMFSSRASVASGGNWITSQRNLRIYPPLRSDPTGNTPQGVLTGGAIGPVPAKYADEMWDKLAGMDTIRPMDAFNTNALVVRDFSDFKSPNFFSTGRFAYVSTDNIGIVSIGPVPDGVDPWYFTGSSEIPDGKPSVWCLAYCQTDRVHGLFEGAAVVGFWGCGACSTSNGMGFNFDGGVTVRSVHIVDATHFIAQMYIGTNTMVLTSSTSGGFIAFSRGTYFSLADMVEICNGAPDVGGPGTIRNLWHNIPATATPACNQATGLYIGTNLIGKCYGEFSNESWNYQLGPTSPQARNSTYRIAVDAGQTPLDDNAFMLGYVTDMKQAHADLATGFTAAGKRPNLKLVLGGQANIGETGPLVDMAIGLSAPFDVLATSFYPDNFWPFYRTFPATDDTMTAEQAIDQFQLILLDGFFQASSASQQRAMLNGKSLQRVEVMHYEASTSTLTPGGSSVGGLRLGMEMIASVRWYDTNLQWVQSLADQGSTLCLSYFWSGYWYDGHFIPAGWTTYFGFDQQLGTGNPAIDTANALTPLRTDLIKSETGGALAHFGSLALSSPSTPALSVNPRSGTVVGGVTTLPITATLLNSSAGLTATLTGLGSLSTASPTNGVAFTYTPPTGVSGPFTVTVHDATDNLVDSCTGTYAPPSSSVANLTTMTFRLTSQMPVVPRGTAVWDDTDVANPDVAWDVHSKQWVMNYSAYSTARNEWSLCFAYSPDLFRWTREVANPVMRPDNIVDANHDGYICCNGSVLYFGGQYMSWYQNQFGSGMWLATSPDRITWTRQGRVLAPPAGAASISDFMVRPLGSGLEAVMGMAVSGIEQFARSTSSDGIAWTTPLQINCPVATPNFLQDNGEPGFCRAGGLIYLTHDGAATRGDIGGVDSAPRRTHLHVSTDNGATYPIFREDVLPIPIGNNSLFDTCKVIDGDTIHAFCASGPGTSVSQGMMSSIYHYVAKLPWATPA